MPESLISYDEFLEKTKQPDFEKDPGWESIDQKPVYTYEEYKEFERRRQEEVQRLIQEGLIQPQPVYPPQYGYHHPPQPAYGHVDQQYHQAQQQQQYMQGHPPHMNQQHNQGHAPPPHVNQQYMQGHPPSQVNQQYMQEHHPPPQMNQHFQGNPSQMNQNQQGYNQNKVQDSHGNYEQHDQKPQRMQVEKDQIGHQNENGEQKLAKNEQSPHESQQTFQDHSNKVYEKSDSKSVKSGNIEKDAKDSQPQSPNHL